MNEWKAQLAESAEWMVVQSEFTCKDWRVWFVGLSHFQHFAAIVLLNCSGTLSHTVHKAWLQ